MKVQVNEPEDEVVTVVGDVVIVFPLKVIVIFEEAAKPVPDTVSVIPVRPLIGNNVIDAVTVNVAVAELELASLAATV